MATYDTIIKNGIIFDGTRIPRYKGDIGIKDGVIAKIGRLDENDMAAALDAIRSTLQEMGVTSGAPARAD